jgi:uncharacterized membrane protein YhhN
VLPVVVGVSGLVYLLAATRKVRAVVYLLKPGTMLLIILLAALRLAGSAYPDSVYGVAIVAGLVCSVVGDVFLMLPRDRFIAGLVAFLMAHLCYIGGMGKALAGLWGGGAGGLMAAHIAAGFALLLAGTLLFRRLAAGLKARHKARLLAPVLVYSTVISVMVWLALLGLPGRAALPYRPALAAAGAVLFYLSDSALAWDKFVGSLPGREILVMGTYFAAQTCFALSII